MTFTLEDKRDKIRSQLLYELGHTEIPQKKENKPTCAIRSARYKFLQNPEHLKPANQKRSW
jgi:hypothetical protein